MAPTRPHGGGLLQSPQDAPVVEDAQTAQPNSVEPLAERQPNTPTAQLFQAPEWMHSYGMPVAISCAVGYSLVGLVMVEPAAPGAMFHPAAIAAVLLFGIGFVQGMRWWTTACESGRSRICPHCGRRTRLEAFSAAATSHACRCGERYLIA